MLTTFLPVDVVADEETIMANKVINEEYKIWKKNAPYLYDVMYRYENVVGLFGRLPMRDL